MQSVHFPKQTVSATTFSSPTTICLSSNSPTEQSSGTLSQGPDQLEIVPLTNLYFITELGKTGCVIVQISSPS